MISIIDAFKLLRNLILRPDRFALISVLGVTALQGCSGSSLATGAPYSLNSAKIISSSRSVTTAGHSVSDPLSTLEIKTMPRATCYYPTGPNLKAVRFISDSMGSARFQYSVPPKMQAFSRTIKCQKDGLEKDYLVSLDHSRPTTVPLANSLTAVQIVSDSAINAAISRLGFDPRIATEAQLEEANLPPRPNGFSPLTEGYQVWLRVATTPMSNRSGPSVIDTDVSNVRFAESAPVEIKNWNDHGARSNQDITNLFDMFANSGVNTGNVGKTTGNQAGFVVSGPVGSFQFNQGYFTVPNASCEVLGAICYASIWIGIDDGTPIALDGNVESNNIFQAGLAISVYNDAGSSVYSDVLWHEYYSSNNQPGSEVQQSDQQVSVGDQLYCSIAEQTGGNEVSVRHYCTDLSTVPQYEVSANWSNVGSHFVGDEVEWILELPQISGVSKPLLADVGYQYITGATYQSGTSTFDANSQATTANWVLANLTMTGVSQYGYNVTLATASNTVSNSSWSLNYMNSGN